MRFRTAVEFQTAISSGDYGTADRLLGELRHEVEAYWPDADPEERRSVAGQICDLLAWARVAALAGRSHAQRKLAEITRHSAYSTGVRDRKRFELEG